MQRLEFDAEGNLVGVDNARVNREKKSFSKSFAEDKLMTSADLLSNNERKIEQIFQKGWSLFENGKFLPPLKFSNGKTQEDVVDEIVELIKNGNKLIFVHGVCGTGKSAIALNVAKEVGRASIVVPIKSLQTQYWEDYREKKYVLKENGEKLKIEMITGRDNHDSVFFPGKSCADAFLPDTIQITEKNLRMLKEYYSKNPFIENKLSEIDVRKLRRVSIAPTNPYWSPIVSATYELRQLKDARKRRYAGLNGKEFIFYHRKAGCSYYDQYHAYLDADVIIFNSAKYKIETELDRKPLTEIEIIDEADEFLDKFANQHTLNLTWLSGALGKISSDDFAVRKARDRIINLIEVEEIQKRVVGVDERKIYQINETKLAEILGLFLDNSGLQIEISLDEMSYANKAVEAARNFEGLFDEVYAAFRKTEDGLCASLATTNISKKFKEMTEKNKCFVFMSGTLHSDEVLKHIFGIDDYKIVDAEGIQQGTIEIHRTGKEFDCKYANFNSGRHSREDYLDALSLCLARAQKPILVHVNAFEDLPTADEIEKFGIRNLISREDFREVQRKDKIGSEVRKFKEKKIDVLFTTKCSRGIDFPGDVCRSVVFTKYPNPNIRDIFWRVLKETREEYFWEFYKDRAWRDFLQKIYRAVRFEGDHVFVLSPDSRALAKVREIQMMNHR